MSIPHLRADHVSLELPWKVRFAIPPFEFTRVLDDASFHVSGGEIVGLIGTNGAGKTTLLRSLAGIFRPSSGGILRSPGTSVGLMAINMGYMMHLTGAENALQQCMMSGLTKAESLERVERLGDISGLSDRVHKPLFTYSAGMIARLAYGAAECAGHNIQLVDEIFGVGDETFQAMLRARLSENAKAGKGCVIVSHDMELMKSLATRVVTMHAGRTIESSTSVSDAIDRHIRASAT